MPWGAVAGAVVGGLFSSKSNSAAKKMNERALAEQRRQYEETKQMFSPYADAGKSALYRLSDLYGMERAAPVAPNRESYLKYRSRNPKTGVHEEYDDAGYATAMDQYNRELAAYNQPRETMSLAYDPGYQFRVDQGMKGVMNQASARGIRNSGRTLKDIVRFGQDYASNEFGNYANRLSALAGLGQTATNSTAGFGATAANNVSSLYNNRANQYQSSYANMNNAAQSGLNNYMFYNYLNKPRTTAAVPGGGSYNQLYFDP